MEDSKMDKVMKLRDGATTGDAESLRSVHNVRDAEVVDLAIVKTLKRKADGILLPMLAVMYLFKCVAQQLSEAHD